MRLYFFVLYSLSGIQKGIQSGHAALEYANLYSNTEEYQEFIKNHKTFILLDGGGSNEMEKIKNDLATLEIRYAEFREPDLNNAISAIAILVPERIYSYKFTAEDFLSNRNQKEMALSCYLKNFNLAKN